jgi:hypothetical protein
MHVLVVARAHVLPAPPRAQSFDKVVTLDDAARLLIGINHADDKRLKSMGLSPDHR